MMQIGSRGVGAVFGLILAIMVLCCSTHCSATLMYTYLHHGARFCAAPDGLIMIGREDRYMVHYGFRGETELEGTVSLLVRTGSWLGPTVERILDPSHSSITLDLLTGDNYRFCFEYDGGRTRIPFEFEIGRANHNTLVDANEAQIDAYMDMVQSIEHSVSIVADEVELLTTRQEAFDNTVRSTYVRVIVCTLISAVLVLATATWQTWTLKRFFRAKKIV